MKYLLLLSILLTGCIKNVPCNKKVYYPVNINLEHQSSISYIDVRVGNPDPYTQNIYQGNEDPTQSYIDTLDITHVVSGGVAFVEIWVFSLDGSYQILRDTVNVRPL